MQDSNATAVPDAAAAGVPVVPAQEQQDQQEQLTSRPS
jgi:hypothetical protein